MASIARSRQIQERNYAMVVGTGLYVLRYVSAPSTASYPVVEVSPHSPHGDITLISAPGGSDNCLFAPGDCIIVRAEASGSLNLTISTDNPRSSLDAEFRLERLTPPARPAAAPRAPASVQEASAQSGGVSVMAHVSRRGDIVARPGEWICGPELPLPIEGLQIDWPNRPAGVELTYAVTASRASQKRKLAGNAGKFAGTRGKAMPLVAVEMSLGGREAPGYELVVEALFLGASIASQRGSAVSMAGPSGREPMVGFRFDVVKKRAAVVRKSIPSKASPGKSPRQVRVYRPAVVAGRSLSPATLTNSNL